MNRTFQQAYHITGALAANVSIVFTAPFDMSLIHVSAVASNDSDATMIIGTSGDGNGYLESTTIGDSATPKTFNWDDFDGALAGGQAPHIAKGTVVIITIDYDGAGGTAAENLTLVLTFTEG